MALSELDTGERAPGGALQPDAMPLASALLTAVEVKAVALKAVPPKKAVALGWAGGGLVGVVTVGDPLCVVLQFCENGSVLI